jgi:spore maturation protein CgeB
MLEVLMDMSDDYKVGVYQHPGYVLGGAHENRYAVDFAKAINSAKICVTCSGMPKSRFGKYVEIPACNTAISADIPNEEQGAFEKFVIEINVEDDNDTIINKLKHYLDNEEELKKITQRGYLLMNKYTQDWYASVFINKLNSILNS